MLSATPERRPEDRGQEEAHFQASAGRVHRPREDRERVRAERRSSSGLRTRRQSAGKEEEEEMNRTPWIHFLLFDS